MRNYKQKTPLRFPNKVGENLKEIEINSWDDFENCLHSNVGLDRVLVRNYFCEYYQVEDGSIDTSTSINALQSVRDNGTDRMENSPLHDAEGFDFCGKRDTGEQA